VQRHRKAIASGIPNPEVIWGMDPQSVDALTRTYRAWVSQATRMQDEALRFAQERFTKDLEAAVQLSRCKDPTEAIALQTEFVSKLAADYFAEGQRIVELMDEMAKELSEPRKLHH
jgi:hypothetical protein